MKRVKEKLLWCVVLHIACNIPRWGRVFSIWWSFSDLLNPMFPGWPGDGSILVYLHISYFNYSRRIALRLYFSRHWGREGGEWWPPVKRWMSAALRAHLGCHIPSWHYTWHCTFCLFSSIKLIIWLIQVLNACIKLKIGVWVLQTLCWVWNMLCTKCEKRIKDI